MATRAIPAETRGGAVGGVGPRRLRTLGEPVVFLAIGVLTYLGLTSGYERLVMSTALVNIILALSFSLTLETGRLSLAQASLAGVGAYVSGYLAVNSQMALWATILIGALAAAVAGAVLGGLALRLAGFYFVVATLAFSEIFVIVVSGWASITGGLDGLNDIPSLPAINLGPVSLTYAYDQSLTGYYYTLLVVAAIVFLLCRLFTGDNRLGRRVRAVGDDDVLARSLGVPVTTWRLMAFGVGAFFAGLAGGLQASLLGGASPSSYDLFQSVTVLAMVFIGGRRSLAGAAIGAVLLTVIPELLKFGAQTQLIYTGVFFLAVAFLLPQGLVPSTRAILARMRR